MSRDQLVNENGEKCGALKSFFFTHAILSNVPKESTAYQMAGRLCGGFRGFIGKILIISTTNHWNIITKEEEIARTLSSYIEIDDDNFDGNHKTAIVTKQQVFGGRLGKFIYL